VFSGGSSVGERDLILDVLQRRGHRYFQWHRCEARKPTVFGAIGARRCSAACRLSDVMLSNACMMLMPFLRAVARLPPWTPRRSRPLAHRRFDDRPASVLYGEALDGRAELAFKGLGRHHEHGARRAGY
jgi:molybdopterin biosynthesis enzyme